jgi:hypothetical protein
MLRDYYIYDYYPKGIMDSFSEEYNESVEHQRLKNSLFKAKKHFDLKAIITEFNRIVELNQNSNCKFIDSTNFDFNDRSFNFQFRFENKKRIVKTICCNISVLMPFYCIYFIERRYDKVEIGYKVEEEFFNYNFNLFPKQFKKLKNDINSVLRRNGFFYINSEDLDTVVPEITFDSLEYNKMTLFNCLFLNEPYIIPKL